MAGSSELCGDLAAQSQPHLDTSEGLGRWVGAVRRRAALQAPRLSPNLRRVQQFHG